VPCNDSAEVNSFSNDDDEYEVDSILSFRRVGKKRGKIEYLTKWVGGEETWEPAGSFRLDRPDSDESEPPTSLFLKNFGLEWLMVKLVSSQVRIRGRQQVVNPPLSLSMMIFKMIC